MNSPYDYTRAFPAIELSDGYLEPGSVISPRKSLAFLNRQRLGTISVGDNSPEREARYFFSRASIPAWAIASSISDLAPLAAIAPMVSPSTLMGNPP